MTLVEKFMFFGTEKYILTNNTKYMVKRVTPTSTAHLNLHNFYTDSINNFKLEFKYIYIYIYI